MILSKIYIFSHSLNPVTSIKKWSHAFGVDSHYCYLYLFKVHMIIRWERGWDVEMKNIDLKAWYLPVKLPLLFYKITRQSNSSLRDEGICHTYKTVWGKYNQYFFGILRNYSHMCHWWEIKCTVRIVSIKYLLYLTPFSPTDWQECVALLPL